MRASRMLPLLILLACVPAPLQAGKGSSTMSPSASGASALAAAATAGGMSADTKWTEIGAPFGAFRFYSTSPERQQFGLVVATDGTGWVAINGGTGWFSFLQAGDAEHVAFAIQALNTTTLATPGQPGPEVTAPTLSTGADGALTFSAWYVSPPAAVPSRLTVVAPATGSATIRWDAWAQSGGNAELAAALDSMAMGTVGMRKGAVAKIAAMTGADATAALVKVLKDSSPLVRADAASALGTRGDTSAVAGLTERFGTETDPAARLAEIAALAALGAPESKALLQQVASTDPDPAVRLAASGPH